MPGIFEEMIEVKFCKPEKSVSWLVKQFESIRLNGNTEMEDKFVPRNDSSIVFHFKSRPYMTDPFHAELPPFFVVPLISKANTIKVSGVLDTFIVTCHPSVLSSVFHIDLSPRPEISIPLPHERFFPLWKKLTACSDTKQRINCFTRFLTEVHPRLYTPDLIDMTFNNILDSCIKKPLPEILGETPKSVSVIQRSFIKRVGISPKTLSRIVRVNYLLDKIKQEKVVSFQDLVFDGNYYDQAHFIKDFKAITGETPGFYFRRNLEFSHALSGKNY